MNQYIIDIAWLLTYDSNQRTYNIYEENVVKSKIVHRNHRI